MSVDTRAIMSRVATAALAFCSIVVVQDTFAATTTASVNFGSNKSAMPSQGLGVASAVYDNYLMSSGVSSALVNAGVKAVRYPGGSYADAFHWQTTTACGGAYVNSSDGFDNFINNVVTPAGAKAIITTNYGSNSACTGGGNPSEAAAWVQYANVT